MFKVQMFYSFPYFVKSTVLYVTNFRILCRTDKYPYW